MQAINVIHAYLRILCHFSYIPSSFPLTLTTQPVAVPSCLNTLCLSMRGSNPFLVSNAPPGQVQEGINLLHFFLCNAAQCWGQQIWREYHTRASCGSRPQRGQQHLQRGISQEHFILWLCCPAAEEKMTAWPFVSKMHFNGLLSPSLRSPPGKPIKTEETLSSVAFAGQQYASTTSEHAGNAFFQTSWQASSLPEDRPSDFTTLQRPCPSGHKETVLEETSPVSISRYRLDPEQPLGLTASEPHWHCGEERKLLKPDKQPSWMTFSFENSAPGGELLIAGSRAECQQAFSQEVESYSCLLCIKKIKKEKMLLHFMKVFKSEKNCNCLVTLSLSPSELSEESKSDLHSKSKGHPKVSGRFNMFEGRVFSGGF